MTDALLTPQAPLLVTQRLELRGWRASDLTPFAALNADPVVMEQFPATMSRADSDAMVERIAVGFRDHGFGLWAVERIDRGEFIGFVGLAVPSFEAPFMPSVEVGWRLGAQHWGHGFATEAAGACLAHAFRTVGLPEVVSFTSPHNTRSVAVMQRLRMTHDAADDFDHPRVPAGHRIERHVLYRMPRRRWEELSS